MDPANAKVVYCRVCGIKSKKSVKIFSRKGRGMGLENKILKCLMLSVRRSDQLPTRVCFPCIDRLDDFSQFLLHVKQAQVKLRAMLKSQGVHVKDQRNVELITTWKALLAHQERESVIAERGRKRKRKLEEKVYDLSNSSFSDSVSEDSSSDSGEPDDAYNGCHPTKKVALASGDSLGYPFKNEVLDVARASPDVSSQVQQSTVGGVPHSQNVSPTLNSVTKAVCSSFPQHPATLPTTAPSQMSEMQKDEISTSQEPVTVVQGSSSSGHQPTTTASDTNMTVPMPILFPAQVSNPLIVLPGTSLKSPGGGVVPFYIWNMSKGGSPSDVARRPLPPSKKKKPSCKAILSEKPKVDKEEATSYTHYDPSKRLILPKQAAGNATFSNGTMVIMDSNNANSLPTSVPSQRVHITVRCDEPSVSSLCSEMKQGSSAQEVCPIEPSAKISNMVVNASPTVLDQESVLSQLSSYSKQSSSISISSINSENAAQVINSRTRQMLKESPRLNEPQLCVENVKEVGRMKSCNETQSVVEKSQSIQLPASQEDNNVNFNDSQDDDSDSLEPLMLSKDHVMSRDDGSELPRDVQDSLTSNSCPEVCAVSFSSKVLVNSDASSPAAKPLLPNKPQTVLGKVNSVVSEGECSISHAGELKQVEHPSVTSGMPAEVTIPPKDLSNRSTALGLDVKILSSNTSLHSESSNSVQASRKEMGIEVVDICDIPPLIPISESFLNHYSNIECKGASANVAKLTKSLANENDLEPETLLIDEICQTENSNSESCLEVGFISATKGTSGEIAPRSDNTTKNSALPHKPTEWMSAEPVGSDFTVNPDYSVVKCCLCSTGSYPFLITLASASDHCKFIHPQGIGSFGCIKCDFTTDQEQDIAQQLQSLHNHASTGCPPPGASDAEKSPQENTKDGGLNVVEVKMEPVDVYETALMNLKNSLRKVNMPRFRKLITSCKSSSPDAQKCTPPKVKEEVVESSTSDGDCMIISTSRNRLFTRKGSAYICRMCTKKSYSKHQVKIHIARHKPHERERFLLSDLHHETDVPSKDNCSGETNLSEATSATAEKMVFEIPPIKVEKDDSPQAVGVPSDRDTLRNVSDSPSNILNFAGNGSTLEGRKRAVNSVEKSHVVNDGETSKNKTFNSNKTPSSSGVKIPFIKGEPGKLPSADKVTHKANTSDSFSFTPLLNRSDGADQGYVNHSRNFRSKPIVKPLYKSPTPKEKSSASSSSGNSSGLKPKIENPSPSKPEIYEKHSSKSLKKSSVKFHKPSTVQDSPSAESHLNKSTDEGAVIGTASHTPHNSQLLIRQNSSVMKVIRPKPSQELKRGVEVNTSSSPMCGNTLHQQDSSSKSPSEIMTVNGLVLKVPFIKLQRLNLFNIDPKLGVVNQSHADGSSVESVSKGKEGSSHGAEVKEYEKSRESSMPCKPKKEASEKNEESILGW